VHKLGLLEQYRDGHYYAITKGFRFGTPIIWTIHDKRALTLGLSGAMKMKSGSSLQKWLSYRIQKHAIDGGLPLDTDEGRTNKQTRSHHENQAFLKYNTMGEIIGYGPSYSS
jgi:hypothetical protein